MANMVKVSVIVPTYNVEEDIRIGLDCLLGQTLKDIEIVCVDDCSTDNTVTILKSYEEKYPNIKCIYNSSNVSAAQCRKQGVLAASGKYIMFLDGDDYMEPEACQIAFDAIEEKKTDMVQFDSIVENFGGVPEARIESNQRALAPYLEEKIEGDLLKACFLDKLFSLTIWNKIFKASLCKSAMAKVEEGYFPKANDLYAMFIILNEAESYSAIENRLYHYCFGKGMTGREVMSFENFTRNCQGARVYKALTRYIAGLSDEGKEKCTPVIEKIRDNLKREQISRWKNNLIEDQKNAGFELLCGLWDGGAKEIISTMAAMSFYDRATIAKLVKEADALKFTRRKIRTVALFYHSIFNGGAQRVVAILSNYLSNVMLDGEYRYKVILITSEEPCEGEYELDEKVTRYVLPDDTLFPKELSYSVRADAWYDVIEKYSIDLIIDSNWVSPLNTWDMIVCKSHPSHPAYAVHSHSCFGVIYRMTNKIVEETKYSFGIADGVITLSDSDRKYWGYINPNVHKIINPCFISGEEENRTSGDGKHIVWVGRISWEKQPLDMINIMKLVAQQEPDAVCHIIGDGNETLLEKLQTQIEAEGLEKNVILEGFHTDVDSFYMMASVLMMTSTYEGFALTAYEAAAHGVPTVLYDLPWLEYYNMMSGWASVGQNDAQGAAEEILHLLQDREYWQDKSDRLFQSFKAYEKKDIVLDWIHFIDTIESGSNDVIEEKDPLTEIMIAEMMKFQMDGVKKHISEKDSIKKKLQITYDEKFERGVQIKALKSEIKELKKKNKELKKQLDRPLIVRIYRKLKRIIRNRVLKKK